MQDYRKLYVWQKAHALALASYAISDSFTQPSAWPLREQLVRAAISIPSNIAEGAGRSSKRDFRRFLFHSLGSCNELEYDFLLARDLRFLPGATYTRLTAEVEEVRRMLTSLAERLTT